MIQQHRVQTFWQSVQSASRAFLPAVLVLLMGFALYLVARYEAWRSVDLELTSWADQLSHDVYSGERWQLAAFGRSELDAPHWCIVSSEGDLADIDGFLPGLLGRVRSIPPDAFHQPITTTSRFGVVYRLLARKFEGGSVVVGIHEPEHLAGVDHILAENVEKFGSTLGEARRVSPREVGADVEAAVVADSGDVQSAWGGIPLATQSPLIPDRPSSGDLVVSGRSFRVLKFAIRSVTGRAVGLLSVYKETTLLRAVLRSQLALFTGVAVIFFFFTLFLVLRREMAYRAQRLSPNEALGRGEGDQIEFKESFQWDVKAKAKNEGLRKEVVGTVAAFGNKRGGQLLIGVKDDGSVAGLAGDLNLVGGNTDIFLRVVGSVLNERLGRSSSVFWDVGLATLGGEVVCVIDVRRSREPVFVREAKDKESEFYVRAGALTQRLDLRDAHRYMIEHWRPIPFRWLTTALT